MQVCVRVLVRVCVLVCVCVLGGYLEAKFLANSHEFVVFIGYRYVHDFNIAFSEMEKCHDQGKLNSFGISFVTLCVLNCIIIYVF